MTIQNDKSPAPGAEDSELDERFAELNLYAADQSVDTALALLDEGRQGCPVRHSDSLGGHHILLSADVVKKVMIDWRRFGNSPSIVRPLAARPEEQFRNIPNDFDGPEHSSWRKLYTGAFGREGIEAIKPRVRQDISDLLTSMAEKGGGDIVTDLADIVPARAIFYLLGIDDTGRQAEIFDIHRRVIADLGDQKKTAFNRGQLANFGREEAVRRLEHPREDVLTELTHAEKDGVRITTEQVGIVVSSFLSAGSGTTASAIANLTQDILSRPDIKRQLLAEPELIPAAVEESLRLHAPFVGMFRRLTEDAELGGVPLEREDSVFVCWHAANMDPAAYEDPHEFRLDRRETHFTFGLGRHSCVGAPLARMELQTYLEIMLRDFPDMELADSSPPPRQFIGGGGVAIQSLPVIFGNER